MDKYTNQDLGEALATCLNAIESAKTTRYERQILVKIAQFLSELAVVRAEMARQFDDDGK